MNNWLAAGYIAFFGLLAGYLIGSSWSNGASGANARV